MAKILTDKELLAIVSSSILQKEIDDEEIYLKFLDELGELITHYHGGRAGRPDKQEGEYYIPFHLTEEVPDDGGVYAEYDTDVIWVDGVEDEEKRKNKRIDDDSDI